MDRKNIILFVVDALRADHLGCYGYKKNTSPNINRLAKDGIKFNNAFCCANITDPSVTSIMSGKYPITHGIRNHGMKVSESEVNKFYNSNTKLLSKILKEKGYQTFGLDWLGRWHKEGFDHYSGNIKRSKSFRVIKTLLDHIPNMISDKIRNVYHERQEDDAHLSNMPNARELIDETVQIIKERQRPFFILAHMWDTHTPYNFNAPERMDEQFLNGDGEKLETLFDQIENKDWENFLMKATGDAKTSSEVVATYDSAIRFVDEQVGRLVNFLKKENVFEDTIIIITSDHGESLTEHGIYFDHHGLYDQTMRIPLIISNLTKEGHTIDSMVQHVDLVPTILDKLGAPNKRNDMDGESIFPISDSFRSFVYAEETLTAKKRAIRTKNWKYIKASSKEEAICENCGFIHGDVEELYDLREDPKEEKNVIDSHPEKKKELEEKMKAFLSDQKREIEKKRIQESIDGLGDEV